MLGVFVIQTWYELCVPDYGPMQYAVYVFILYAMIMLCYVQLVLDLGPMQ